MTTWVGAAGFGSPFSFWFGWWWSGLVVGFLVGDVFAVEDNAAGGMELLVVGVFDRGAEVDVLAERPILRGEVEDAFGLGIGGEPVLAVDLLVVGGKGRLQVFVA